MDLLLKATTGRTNLKGTLKSVSLPLVLCLLSPACDTSTRPSAATGGKTGTVGDGSGGDGSGGVRGTGGRESSGGSSGTGGRESSGGSSGAGGRDSSGGSTGSGGRGSIGGSSGTGGVLGSGGSSAAGGSVGTGGAPMGGNGGLGGRATGGSAGAMGGRGGNASALSFAPPVRYYGGGWEIMIQAGDLNGDGKIDIVAANFSSPDANGLVYLNTGNGTFAAPTKYNTGKGAGSVALADFSGDGRLDILLGNNTSSNLSLLINAGNGVFGSPTNISLGSPLAVAAGDFSGDGKTDFIASGTVSGLYVNQGGGTAFAARAALPVGGLSLSAGDLNGDGKLDIVAGGVKVSVLLNSGDGTFVATAYATGAKAQGNTTHDVAIGDLNGDGRPDLATANDRDGTMSVLFNAGNGTFGPGVTYPSGVWPTSVKVGDLNGDGKPDLVVANSDANDQGANPSGVKASSVAVFTNKGDGTFGAPDRFLPGVFAESVALADLDGDGKLDIAAGDGGGSLDVLINKTE